AEPRVQQTYSEPRQEEPSVAVPQAPAEPRKNFNFFAWVDKTFGKNKYAFYGGLLALLVALLIFAIGFWRVLFISLLVLVGVAIGQVVDGDPRIIRTIRNLFPSDDGDE
ncbi:MAG: DUF2273 domain-containing protein, partial [Coriobacteriales bacterium]|nr:DUF2273 domain-containing protein [Coriobacteriales bacterium]